MSDKYLHHANPEMLVLAREYAGHTQSSLTKQLPFTQATLSRYESGIQDVPLEHLESIAHTLDRPLSFFYRNARRYAASGFYHRKKSGLSARDLNRIHAQVNDLRIQAGILLREAAIESAYSFHRLGLKDGETPEEAARRLRHLWQLPSGPILNLVDAIESAGGIVFSCDFGTHKMDGLSQWPLDNDDCPPVLFVNQDSSGDRQRMTLAHEIGHIILHYVPSDGDEEDDANRFAAEFLMPADDIASSLSRLTLHKAAALKSYWKVSMQSLIRRAHDLGKITNHEYRVLNIQISRYGYKKVEPILIPAEVPGLLNEIVAVHRHDHRQSDGQIAEKLDMPTQEFQDRFGHGTGGLRLVV